MFPCFNLEVDAAVVSCVKHAKCKQACKNSFYAWQVKRMLLLTEIWCWNRSDKFEIIPGDSLKIIWIWNDNVGLMEEMILW